MKEISVSGQKNPKSQFLWGVICIRNFATRKETSGIDIYAWAGGLGGGGVEGVGGLEVARFKIITAKNALTPPPLPIFSQ